MRALDSIAGLKEYDKSGMLEIIESFPDQCQDAKRIGYEFELPEGLKKRYRNIVCVGMGGSAIGADLIRSYILDDIDVPFFVNRNYLLPNFADDQTLVIVSSYSGNTEESLSAYRDAKSRSCEIIAITSGGKLSKMAKDDGVAIIDIPAGLPPRAALGYSFFPLLILLSKIGIINDQAIFIDNVAQVLRKLRRSRLDYKIKGKNNQAKKIAVEIYGKLPVVYGSQSHIDSVVTRWRGQLAENSKTLASSHLFPEMSHNEIVGWEYPKTVLKNSIVIMLKDAADHPGILKRMDAVKKLLGKDGIGVIEVNSTGKGLLARMFSLVYIADYVSFYLSILNKTDPLPVERITFLKKELSR
ncbi:MAG: bifunctional phosphoglucose/phosphomannose isomerase [Candidatus Omnitrophota bacterium]|nr:bifunctional phosphoglucose/phosphomannose isomerase [Candidatus Omnitrophota bacterium]